MQNSLRRSKIQPRENLRGILGRLKKQKKRIVFTNGCFDLLHPGHVRAFEKAKSLGDILVVALNSDASLKRLKGPKRPLVPQNARAQVLAALETVDYVTFFGENTPAELISELRPDVLVKGGDYKLNEIAGREYVKKVVRVPLVKGYSTSALIKKIVERYK
ncbi:MAG: D-glycero-beta-D-manno-heptose 1-phosphate adenylyltransferase [Elusimicrobiota bacterium]